MCAHQQRDERRAAEVDGQEPQRLADAEPRDAHDLGGHTGHEQADEAEPDGADEHDGGPQQPHGALAHVVGGALAGGLQAFPVPQRRETAQDEEERHDLHDPAGGGEPGLGVEGVLEDRPVGAEADAHHEGVQRHDEDEARGAHEVDGAVAAAGRCADSRGGSNRFRGGLKCRDVAPVRGLARGGREDVVGYLAAPLIRGRSCSNAHVSTL